MRSLLEVRGGRIESPSGRVLVQSLSLSLGAERVALVGRNGVGKTLLLEALASGEIAGYRRGGAVHHVPQLLPTAPGLGGGEVRRARLLEAAWSGADVLLLDEPTAELDADGVAWLRAFLRGFRGAAVVASHDRRLLADFGAFFWIREAGCRAFVGSLDELDAEAERERVEGEARYAAELARLADEEEHTLHVARRKARKKLYGRCRELDRGTPRGRLNEKRGQAQVSHGKLARLREERISARRALGLAARRGLAVELPLVLHAPGDGPRAPRPRTLVVGPNGSGKTTLLGRMMRGEVGPPLGAVGHVDQAARAFQVDGSLLEILRDADPELSLASAAERVVAHRLPLALAERPMRSLSPGERVRAALVVLFQRRPRVETLVLDEPTFGLDLFGQRALFEALRAWPGGLVIATHDDELARASGIDDVVDASALRRAAEHPSRHTLAGRRDEGETRRSS